MKTKKTMIAFLACACSLGVITGINTYAEDATQPSIDIEEPNNNPKTTEASAEATTEASTEATTEALTETTPTTETSTDETTTETPQTTTSTDETTTTVTTVSSIVTEKPISTTSTTKSSGVSSIVTKATTKTVPIQSTFETEKAKVQEAVVHDKITFTGDNIMDLFCGGAFAAVTALGAKFIGRKKRK